MSEPLDKVVFSRQTFSYKGDTGGLATSIARLFSGSQSVRADLQPMGPCAGNWLFLEHLFGLNGLAPMDMAIFKKKMAFASHFSPNRGVYANGAVLFYLVAPLGATFRE